MTDNLPAPTEPATPSALQDRIRFAQALATADLLPAAYRGKPANVLLAIEWADALGIPPMAAIQGVHIIDGKPSASSQLVGALVRRAGHRLRVEANDTRAVAEIVRRDDPGFTFRSVWDLDRATAAGLIGKAQWKAYTAAMLKARAIAEAARDACPEVLTGVPAAEWDPDLDPSALADAVLTDGADE